MTRAHAGPGAARLIVCVAAVLVRPAAGSDRVDLDWHGVLEAGARYSNRYHSSDIANGTVYNEEYYQIGRVKLEAEIDIGKRLEGRFDLRGDVNDFSVVLGKAYVDMDVTEWLQLRVGNAKREFTLEEMVGREELRTPGGSLAQEHVESFHVLGYAFGVHARGRWDRGGDRRTTGRLGVSIDGAGRQVSTASVEHDLSDRIAAVGSYLLLVRTATRSRPVMVSGMAGAGWELDGRLVYGAIELVGGRDPNASALRRRMGGTDDAAFGLIRVAAFPFWKMSRGLMSKLEPGLTLVYLVPDFALRSRGRAQVIPSCNLYFTRDERVRLMLAGDFLNHADLAARELRKESYGATIQLQLAW